MSAVASTDILAVILAAGRGTRMGKITETLPKPLVPVLGKPALHRVIDSLAVNGVRRFAIVTGYLSEQVRDSLAAYTNSGLEIGFAHQDEQLGTAHAFKLTREMATGGPVILAFADIMTDASNYGALVNQFIQNRCAVTAGVRDVGDPWRAAAVYFDDELNIRRIVEKPPQGTSTTPWGHAGMYCLGPEIYSYVEQVKPSARGEYEITDAVAAMIADGLKCQAVKLHGYWKDLATMEDVEAAEVLIRNAESA